MENPSPGTSHFHCAEAVISYVEGPPNGTPLVLIHGVGSRWQPFQSIIPALVEKYHVYALDLRGHGRSSHTPGAYRLDDYTGDVDEFISRQVQAPAVVYGHSLGALIASNLAAKRPDCVRALVLGDPPLFYWDTPIEQTFWLNAFKDLLHFMIAYPDRSSMHDWLSQNAPNMTPERRDERVRSLERLDADVVRAVISGDLMKGISLPAITARVPCPVLLLRGNPDLGSALRAQDVAFAVANFRNIQVLEMETIGHGIIPAALLPRMIAFVEPVL